MKRKFLERGDIVIIGLKRRPGIVISPTSYNKCSTVVLICPITSKGKGSPWEVPLPEGLDVDGYVRVDHLKSMDTSTRGAVKIDVAPIKLLEEVLAKLEPLVT